MGKRVRERLGFTPQWNSDIQRWTMKFISKNAWRCDRVEDPDDLMQEAWIIFDKVATAYPRVVEPQHFFSLYRTALTNRFHDKSCHKQRRAALNTSLPSDVSDFFIGRMGEVTNAGYVAALLNEAPEEVKVALQYLSKRDRSAPVNGRRQNLSAKVRSVMGLSSTADPVYDLKYLLTA